MHIVLASDDNYSKYLGVTVLSILKNNISSSNINIHVLDNGISEKNKKNIYKIVEKYDNDIEFYDVRNLDVYTKGMEIRKGLTSTYSRIFIPYILPKDIDKVIYMDVDSIIKTSLDELWNINIDKNFIAGVLDTIPPKYKSIIGLNEKDPYINAGMMIINLKQWREEKVSDKLIEFINNNDGKKTHHDQGAINAISKNRVLILHPKYNCITTFFHMKYKDMMELYDLENYYSEKEILEAIESPVFIHYVPGFLTRPWMKGCKHKRRRDYIEYANETPWKNNIVIDDNRPSKQKILSTMYNILPFKVFNLIYKKLIN